MIDYEDFKCMCDRVARVTGRIDDDTKRVYYEALKDTNRDVVHRAMKRVAREHGFYKFPTLAEIGDAIRDCSEGGRKTPTWCEKCNMTGVVMVEKDGYAFAYRCDCPNGKKVSRHMKDFSSVSHLYLGDNEPIPRPIVPVDGLAALDPGHSFENGVVVEKTCETCWKAFTYEHARPVKAGQLSRFHGERPSICLDCYIDGGRKKGLWK